MRIRRTALVLTLVAATLAVPIPAGAGAPDWTIMSVAQPTGPNGSLRAISCATATHCVAVGDFTGMSAHRDLLAATLSDDTWTAASLDQFAQDAKLVGVSCSAPTFCVAVGSRDAHTLAEHWDGMAWHAIPPRMRWAGRCPR